MTSPEPKTQEQRDAIRIKQLEIENEILKIRIGTKDREIEEECRKHWREIFPDNLECPLVKLVPGSLVFVEGAS